jgi:hypothetical protein
VLGTAGSDRDDESSFFTPNAVRPPKEATFAAVTAAAAMQAGHMERSFLDGLSSMTGEASGLRHRRSKKISAAESSHDAPERGWNGV